MRLLGHVITKQCCEIQSVGRVRLKAALHRMVSVRHQSTARAIRKHRFHLLLSLSRYFDVIHCRGRPILSILPIIDIGHFKNRFADNFFIYYYLIFFMQTNILFTGDIIYW